MVGLLVGGAVGALAGSTTAEPEAIAPTTTSTTTTTTVPVVAGYPTAEPAEIELPPITREGDGPIDPLLAIGLGNQEVIVTVTTDGPELLPVTAPGWVMGLGRSLAAYWDGTWLYLAPLDGGPIARFAAAGQPRNSGEVLGTVVVANGRRTFFRFNLDGPSTDVVPVLEVPESIPDGPVDVVDSDNEGVILRAGNAADYEFFYAGRDGTVLELTEALVLAPDAIAVPGTNTGWVDRVAGEPTESPSPELSGCWPHAFQEDTAMWWCDGGLVVQGSDPAEYPHAGGGGLFDNGRTVLLVDPQGSLEVQRPGTEVDVTLDYGDLLVSAVRP